MGKLSDGHSCHSLVFSSELQSMVFSKSVGKTLFLYTDQADITDFSVKRREELCPLRRGVRVQNISNLDLEKAMNGERPTIVGRFSQKV